MSERSKLTVSHLRRTAFVYVRQSSQAQLERNVESTARQYALVARAIELGFAREQVVVIDEDLGISGSGLSDRSGFARLAAEVALGHAGLVLGLEVSRLARNNVDWYRLLDLCGVTDTVIGDTDGLYHPGSFNDRLLLGLKGTMSEAELHVLRARLEGGIRNKAARGELRKALPVGFVWGEEEGEILIEPDEAVRGAIQTIFDRFAELGSVRQVWLWMRREGVQFPMRRQVEPEHRLVARGLERDWEHALTELAKAEAELALREQQRPRTLTEDERDGLLALGADLGRVWAAPTTTDRDRKQLLRCLIEEVTIDADKQAHRATVAIRWRGGAITELAITLPKPQPTIRTDEATIALLERLASHYDDAKIAGILNRQGRRSARGERFTAIIVGGLRRYRNIPAYQPPAEPPDGELLPVGKAADELGVAASTIFRWLQAGFIAGEQDTPGAPWRIRVNDQLRALFVDDAPAGYVPIVDAMRVLSVSRQTVLQRVKRGELQALHVRNGRRKGLRILVPTPETTLFDTTPMNALAV